MKLSPQFYAKTSCRRITMSDEFYTPPAIVKALGKFDTDPSAGPKRHAKLNIRRNGLSRRWRGRVWMNPPYSDVHAWLRRFIAHGNGIVLVNARCETRWFQELAAGADAMLLLKGRVNFDRPDETQAHPTVGSCLVAYGARNARALQVCRLPGLLIATPRTITAPTRRARPSRITG